MPVKMGIIGYGGMGGYHHKNAVKVEGLEVISAYDIDHVRLEIARENGLKSYDKLEDFLADPETNLVLVSTPNDKHCELVIAALDAGKNVICEKPVAMNTAELDLMIEASERNGKLFTVHQNRRWDKDFVTVKSVIESGVLGNVYSIQSRLHGSGGVMHGWRGDPVQGGGMIYDWGVHFLDQLMFMLGFDNIKNVRCITRNVKTTQVEDYFVLLMELKNGGNVQVEIGTWVLYELPRWMILGDNGTAYIKDFTNDGEILQVDSTQEDVPVIIMTAAGPTRTFAPRPDSIKIRTPMPDIPTQWLDYYENIVDVINNGAELLVKPWQFRKVLHLMEACFESAKTGLTIEL